jgi:hypothetical protein
MNMMLKQNHSALVEPSIKYKNRSQGEAAAWLTWLET